MTISAVRVHVLFPESQIPAVEQSPPLFALREIPEEVTVPEGAL